jgi:dolichol-phosphate mannosyltransferase
MSEEEFEEEYKMTKAQAKEKYSSTGSWLNEQGVAEGQLDEIFNPSSALAQILRTASQAAGDYIPIGLGAIGTFAATSALAGPVVAAMVGTTVGNSMLQSLQNNQNKIPGFIQKIVEKYFGNDSEGIEFALLHAKAAFLDKPEFRWRAQQWPVTLKKNDAEAIIEKNDKNWLEQHSQKSEQGVAEATGDTRFDSMMGKIKAGATPNTPKRFIKDIKKVAKIKYKFQVGDWVTIDPNETAKRPSSGMIGRISIYSSEGDAVVNLSADLQEPIALIHEMIAKWKEGNEIVIGHRIDREDGFIANKASNIFYKLMQYVNPKMQKGGFDFMLIDKKALEVLNQIDERNRFFQGDVLWLGFNTAFIPYTRLKRTIGKSQWSLSKKLKYFIDGLLNTSYVPIRLMSFLGICFSFFGFLYALVIVYNRFIHNTPFTGWAPLMIIILIIGGLIMLMLGIIGEYVWRTYDETRKRPIYIIKDKFIKDE